MIQTRRNDSGLTLIASKRSSLPERWMRMKRNDPRRTAQTITIAASASDRASGDGESSTTPTVTRMKVALPVASKKRSVRAIADGM